MSISLQEKINLRAESYRIRSKNFGEWAASLSESSIVSTELVEMIIGILDHNESMIDNGIDIILDCHDAILSHWVSYDFVTYKDCREQLDFNEVMLSNPVLVLNFINKYHEINTYYDVVDATFKDKVAIISNHPVWGYGHNDTGKIKDFIAALEHNAETTNKSDWRFVDYGGMNIFRIILIEITKRYVSKVNDCPEYRALLDKWNKAANEQLPS